MNHIGHYNVTPVIRLSVVFSGLFGHYEVSKSTAQKVEKDSIPTIAHYIFNKKICKWSLMVVAAGNLTDSEARAQEVSIAWDLGNHKFYP